MKQMTAWLLRFQPNPGARVRLFCFPYAGGGVSGYRNWQKSLPSHVEVLGVQLPGRESRLLETPYDRFRPIVEELCVQLEPYLDRPFMFFGHSMGAMLSYEVARRLQANPARIPARLLVSGRRAPHLPDVDRPIRALPTQAFLQELRTLNGTPAAVLENEEILQLMLPLLRADFCVCETYSYEPGPPLKCPITVFGGLHDPKTEMQSLMGWRDHTVTRFKLQVFPGDHFFLHKCQDELLQVISQELNRL